MVNFTKNRSCYKATKVKTIALRGGTCHSLSFSTNAVVWNTNDCKTEPSPRIDSKTAVNGLVVVYALLV